MMRFVQLRVALCVLALSVAGQAAVAQQPTPKPADPSALIAQLRQRFTASGLTPEQIRIRLREEGYPENLLDPYLPGTEGPAREPNQLAFDALRDIGIADSADVAMLKSLADSLSASSADSLRRTRVGVFGDTMQHRRIVVRADVEDSLIRVDSGYNIFGLDVFRSSRSKFEPNLNGPVDANYRLGPTDQLVLILTGDVEAAHTLEVTREGFIVIPQVGQLFVANLTLGQLEDLLYQRLGRVYSGVRRGAGATTRFSVSIAKLRANQVFVLGEVERPGSYMVSSAGTAITALYAAGGPTANGSMRGVQIKRSDRLVSTLDLYDYLLRGDGSRDARLETGDIVFVPSRGPRVRVVGEVIRPGTYEVGPGETLNNVIAAAGGFRSDASRRRVQIERILPPMRREIEGRERVTIDIESQPLENGNALHLPIEGGDVVRVFPIADRVRNTITVNGNVWRPGPQGLTAGMTVADAIRLAGGPKPDVYLGQVLVSRLRPDSTRVQLRAALRDSLGAIIGDFALKEDDVIEIFSLTDFRPERYVAIGGAVRKGGRYPFRQGMTMRDLVLLAGGLEESAYLREAEIARLPEVRNETATAVTIRVPLDSTYLFERKPGELYLGAPGLPAAANGAPELVLRPYDNVLILQQPSWELQRVVTLSGEVRFPGQYALKNRDERLSDLIERAGGLTEEAYAEGTIFVRAKDNVGRVAIDVPRALKRRNSPENLQLMDGDRITVPVKSYVVTVRGAVNAPNVVAYVPGKPIDYYISQAGGARRNGDKRRAYVTQPSGKRETKSRTAPDPKPMAGSLVVVPDREGGSRDMLATAGAIAQVLTSFIGVYFLIFQR